MEDVWSQVEHQAATHVAVFDGDELIAAMSRRELETSPRTETAGQFRPPAAFAKVPAAASLHELGRNFEDASLGVQVVFDAAGAFLGLVTRQSLIDCLMAGGHDSATRSPQAGHGQPASLVEEESGDDRRTVEDALRALVDASSTQLGEHFFNSMALELARVLRVDYTVIGELQGDAGKSIRTIAAVADGKIIPNFDYDLVNTPCEKVVGREARSFQNDVTDEFPHDEILKDFKVSGYAGVPLFNSKGAALGVIAVMSRAPLSNPGFAETILQLFSARVGVEVERDRSDAALRLSQERLDLAMRGTSDGLWDWEIPSGVEYWSPRFKELLGYADDEIVASFEKFRELLHPEDLSPIERAICAHLEEGRPYDVEFRLRCRSGEYRWFQSRGEALHDERGRPTRMVGSMRDIHDRKQAEADLRRSEEKFRTLSDEIPVSVSIVQDGRRVFTNRWAQEVTSYTRQELMSVVPGEILDDASRELYRQMAEVCLDRGTTSRAELQVIDKQGRERWIDHSVARIEYNRRPAILGASIDITARKLAEKALRDSEHRFRSVFEQAGIAVGLVDSRTGRFLQVNRRYEYLVGYTSEEIAKKSWLDFTHPDDLDDAMRRTRDLRDGRITEFSTEKRLLHRDGTSIWVNLTVSPVWSSDQEPEQHILIVEDASERKRAEDALRQNEQQLRTITDSVPMMIGYVDTDIRYRYVNKRYEEFYGLPRDMIVGRPVSDMVGGAAFDQLRRRLSRVRNGEQVKFEQTVTSPGGPSRTLVVTCVPDISPQSQFRGFYTVIADETQRKQAEDQLRKLRDQLAHMGRIGAMGEMATGLAHELNQPLAAIANYCHSGMTILENGKYVDVEKLHSLLKKMSDQALRSGTIIRRLRDLVRKVPTVRTIVDVGRLIKKSIELMEPDLRFREITLKLDLSDGVPPAFVDSIQIQQVIVNLISNAVEAMDGANGLERVLSIRLAQVGDAVEVAVSDTGHGISAESHETVFDAFYTTKPEGMGMGLAICRSIMESHNGRLWATPNEERGTTFHFTVPISREQSESRDEHTGSLMMG